MKKKEHDEGIGNQGSFVYKLLEIVCCVKQQQKKFFFLAKFKKVLNDCGFYFILNLLFSPINWCSAGFQAACKKKTYTSNELWEKGFFLGRFTAKKLLEFFCFKTDNASAIFHRVINLLKKIQLKSEVEMIIWRVSIKQCYSQCPKSEIDSKQVSWKGGDNYL